MVKIFFTLKSDRKCFHVYKGFCIKTLFLFSFGISPIEIFRFLFLTSLKLIFSEMLLEFELFLIDLQGPLLELLQIVRCNL